MSEGQEFAANQEGAPVIANNETVVDQIKAKFHEETVDQQSYFLGEVPQPHLVDPNAYLPLNSDRLTGTVNNLEILLTEVGVLIDQEVITIQKHQKRISFWEERIEQNRTAVKKNEAIVKQNHVDALFDKKNRDYWFGRSEDVDIDYSHAEAPGRHQDWAWLIKKYGLKNANGTEIDPKSACVEEICNGAAKNLSGAYRGTGEKYEKARVAKETTNRNLIHENAKFLNTNDTLQGYIATTYTNEVEPLQDGVLLMKELSSKLKALNGEDKASYNDLRLWAESFLNDFIKANPRVPQHMVTHFRRIASIPLPPEYC